MLRIHVSRREGRSQSLIFTLCLCAGKGFCQLSGLQSSVAGLSSWCFSQQAVIKLALVGLFIARSRILTDRRRWIEMLSKMPDRIFSSHDFDFENWTWHWWWDMWITGYDGEGGVDRILSIVVALDSLLLAIFIRKTTQRRIFSQLRNLVTFWFRLLIAVQEPHFFPYHNHILTQRASCISYTKPYLQNGKLPA